MAIGTPTKAGSATGTTQVSSASLTTTANIPAGALIIVSVSRQNVNAVSGLTSVTDTVSNTYHSAVGNGDGGQNQYSEVWYCLNATALPSGDTVTINGVNLLSSGPSWGFSVWYVTGIATSSALDKTNGANSNASPWATTAQTTTVANELLWGLFGSNQNEPAAIVNADCVPTSGWTTADAITYGGNSGNSLRTSYQVVSATGSDKIGGTQTAGNAGAFCFVSFEAASGGGNVSSGVVDVGTNGGGCTCSALSACLATATVGDNGGATSREIFEVGGFGGVHRENYEVGGSGGIGYPYSVGASGGVGYPIGSGGSGGLGLPFNLGFANVGNNGAGLNFSFVPSGVVDVGTNGGGLSVTGSTVIFCPLTDAGNNGSGYSQEWSVGTNVGGLSASALSCVEAIATVGNGGSGVGYPYGVGNGGGGLSVSAIILVLVSVNVGNTGGGVGFPYTVGNVGSGLSVSAIEVITGAATVGDNGSGYSQEWSVGNGGSGLLPTGDIFLHVSVLMGCNGSGIEKFYGHIGTPGGSWHYYTLLVWRAANGGWSNVVVKRWKANTSSWKTL